MNKQLKTKWLKALRSGKYKQISRSLHTAEGFCCLGVLCDIQGAKWTLNENSVADNYVVEGTDSEGMPHTMYAGEINNPHALSGMNDAGKSFAEIADYIEANL